LLIFHDEPAQTEIGTQVNARPEKHEIDAAQSG
jgi:hypothetical protein